MIADHHAPSPPWRGLHLSMLRLDRRWLDCRPLDVIAMMTLVLFFQAVEHPWHYLIVVTLLSTAGIVLPGLRQHVLFWPLVTAVLFFCYIAAGLSTWVVNHQYLYVYWALALALTMLAGKHRAHLQMSSGLLIGLCFASATLWKLISPEFPGGGFFHVTLLTDARFENFAIGAGDVTRSQIAGQRDAIAAMKAFGSAVSAVDLIETPRIVWVSKAMAAWTILIEALIAVCYLAPRRWSLSRWRHATLGLFAITTYPIATVEHFAMLLAIMGAANCGKREALPRVFFVLLFLCAPLFKLPFFDLGRRLLVAAGY